MPQMCLDWGQKKVPRIIWIWVGLDPTPPFGQCPNMSRFVSQIPSLIQTHQHFDWTGQESENYPKWHILLIMKESNCNNRNWTAKIHIESKGNSNRLNWRMFENIKLVLYLRFCETNDLLLSFCRKRQSGSSRANCIVL